MKKTILILSISLLALASCSKSYTCNCTDGSPNVIHTEETTANSETEAQENCRSLGTECDLL